MVHDLLLNKRGISAPASHPLRVAVEKYRARLGAELTKARLRRGFASVEDLRQQIETGRAGEVPSENTASEIELCHVSQDASSAKQWAHPRWVRINTIKATMKEQLNTTFGDYKPVESLGRLLETCSSNDQKLHVDIHVPNLLALPPSADLSKTSAYLNGQIILQDKASCFPAYLLDPKPNDGDCVDACAAPGNKTTHLAAITQYEGAVQKPKIYACERDKNRTLTLERMVRTAGAQTNVVIKASQDFLRTNPAQPPWDSVGALLLDPSCSGSGIVGRNESLKVVLPSRKSNESFTPSSKKRKRKAPARSNAVVAETPEVPEEIPISETEAPDRLSPRLAALSTFQLKLLLHAFEFPKARKITYSTCSVHAEENEHVVLKALGSSTAKRRGWDVLRRDEQISGMRAWEIRGDLQACKEIMDGEGVEQIAEACIRCEQGTMEGTQGFFVAAFVRDGDERNQREPSDEEWDGCSDHGGRS